MMRRSTLEILRKWGIEVVPRPDIFKNRNRQVTIVVDESIPEDTIIFEDGITYRMSTTAIDQCVDTLIEHIDGRFIRCFVDAVNSYALWNRILIKKESGTEWLKNAIERVEFMLDMYNLDIHSFSKLDWFWCIAHFGGERNFTQLISDVIAYRTDELFSKCMICANCRCNRYGKRECKEVLVPVDETGTHVKTLRRLDDDQPISNLLEDILPTFAQREECPKFEENETTVIDAIIRFRDIWTKKRGDNDGPVVRSFDRKGDSGFPENRIDSYRNSSADDDGGCGDEETA